MSEGQRETPACGRTGGAGASSTASILSPPVRPRPQRRREGKRRTGRPSRPPILAGRCLQTVAPSVAPARNWSLHSTSTLACLSPRRGRRTVTTGRVEKGAPCAAWPVDRRSPRRPTCPGRCRGATRPPSELFRSGCSLVALRRPASAPIFTFRWGWPGPAKTSRSAGLQSLLLVPCTVLAPSPPPPSGGGIGVGRATPSTGSAPIVIGTPPVATRLDPAGVGFHWQRDEFPRSPNEASEQILHPNGLEGRPSCAFIQMGNWRVPAEAREPTSRRPGRVPRCAGGRRCNPAFVRRRKNRLRESFRLDERGLKGDTFSPSTTNTIVLRTRRIVLLFPRPTGTRGFVRRRPVCRRS